MSDVSGDYAIRISESVLGADERNTVLALVLGVLFRIPVEARARHSERLAQSHIAIHTFVWLSMHEGNEPARLGEVVAARLVDRFADKVEGHDSNFPAFQIREG